MTIIKCKMCGGDLILSADSTVAECEYCGTVQTVPSADNDKKLNLFSRANRLRMACEFDKAAGIYEAIVADFPEEAEAYWGLVLCKFGIEYVDDPGTGKKVPTCHRSSFDSVMDDSNFEQALENADAVARKLYREEAKQIEQIRKSIVEVSSKEDPYDVFICYKETDINGSRTLDSVLAQDLYDALTEKGYRVFFSRITLEDKLGQEYEPYIFAALNSAKVMLAVGTDYEHYNAVWVKNEWRRFLHLIAAGQKKTLIPCYKNIDAYDMPKEFAKLQAQDLGKVGAIQDLLRGIEKIVSRALPQATPQDIAASYAATVNSNVESAISRAFDEIECKDYESARNALDIALTHAPNDNRVLLAATIILKDKREHFYKKYIKAVPHPDPFEIDTINDSSNKEGFLYVFYILNDIQRVKLCLNAGANPNELHEELNGIVKDRGIYTADPNYNRHDGFSTVFLDAVYKRNYDLVELMLESGASFYPEKVCPIETNWASDCANPARCAVLARIMQENDLRMLQLIAKYVPEIVNIEFSDRTDREAYGCLSNINCAVDVDFGYLFAGGIQTPLSYCVEYDIGSYYTMTAKTSLFKGCAFKPVDKVLNAGVEHRYFETAQWLIENGANIKYCFDAVMFHGGVVPQAFDNVSILSCAVNKGNFKMVQTLVQTRKFTTEELSIAATWSRDKTITDFLVSLGANAPKQSSSGGCYVATAVYGSYDCPEVWTLRRFRDDYLRKHILGRVFIHVYYAVSPTVVRWFGDFKAFNKINRDLLDRFTNLLRRKGYSDAPYSDT